MPAEQFYRKITERRVRIGYGARLYWEQQHGRRTPELPSIYFRKKREQKIEGRRVPLKTAATATSSPGKWKAGYIKRTKEERLDLWGYTPKRQSAVRPGNDGRSKEEAP